MSIRQEYSMPRLGLPCLALPCLASPRLAPGVAFASPYLALPCLALLNGTEHAAAALLFTISRVAPHSVSMFGMYVYFVCTRNYE